LESTQMGGLIDMEQPQEEVTEEMPEEVDE